MGRASFIYVRVTPSSDWSAARARDVVMIVQAKVIGSNKLVPAFELYLRVLIRPHTEAVQWNFDYCQGKLFRFGKIDL